jgi:hypothetical protein
MYINDVDDVGGGGHGGGHHGGGHHGGGGGFRRGGGGWRGGPGWGWGPGYGYPYGPDVIAPVIVEEVMVGPDGLPVNLPACVDAMDTGYRAPGQMVCRPNRMAQEAGRPIGSVEGMGWWSVDADGNRFWQPGPPPWAGPGWQRGRGRGWGRTLGPNPQCPFRSPG